MKNCKWVTDRFSDYIDNELTADERDAFEFHISECVVCREDYQEFESAHQALMLLSDPLPVMRPVLSSVRARIRLEEQAATARRRVWAWASAPVFVAAGLTLAVVFLKPSLPLVDNSSVGKPPSPPVVVAKSAPPASAVAPVVQSEQQSSVKATDVDSTEPRRRDYIAAILSERLTSKKVVRPEARKATINIAYNSKLASAVVAQKKADSVEEAQIFVVAYRPPSNYSAKAEDSAGRSLAQVSVRSDYAPDGSIASAEVILHFPDRVSVNNESKDKIQPNNEERSNNDSSVSGSVSHV